MNSLSSARDHQGSLFGLWFGLVLWLEVKLIALYGLTVVFEHLSVVLSFFNAFVRCFCFQAMKFILEKKNKK